MEGEGHASAQSSSNRPQIPQDSGASPDHVYADDYDEHLPRAHANDSESGNHDAHTLNHQRIPSLNPAAFHPLPPGDSSLLYAHSEDDHDRSDGHLDTVDEQEMRRHLMDVESSFLPTFSPIAQGDFSENDQDNSFHESGAGRHSHTLSTMQDNRLQPNTPHRSAPQSRSQSDNDLSSPATPPDAYKTPGLQWTSSNDGNDTGEEELMGPNATASLETMSSSPTAAAAARTMHRAISMAGMSDNETAGILRSGETRDHDLAKGQEDQKEDQELTPRKHDDRSTTAKDSNDERLEPDDHTPSDMSMRQSRNAGSTPGAALLPRQPSSRRPEYLKNRNASQRSSQSSMLDVVDAQEDNTSELALGADYALQSGGALPSRGFSHGPGLLSRTVSLGSMASGLDDSGHETEPYSRSFDRSLATLDEEERSRERNMIKTEEGRTRAPETPRPSRPLTAPTDTIIAQHVRNVQVPESMAKEYRNKTGALSPRKAASSVPSLGRSGKNLTLKEQSSTIERLSKENFDLKLKVMFLSDRLDKLSEEGVREMISENVELKTGLAVMQRDNKALRRKVRDLEQKLNVDGDRPSTARSGASSDDRSPRWSNQESAQDKEDELIYLRERVEEYVTEIEKLRNESVGRESEKRKLAELVKTMGTHKGEDLGAREEMDVWKDLLEQETARREQADDDNRKLREEVFHLKNGNATATGLNHTTNIYNITKRHPMPPTRPRSSLSTPIEPERNGTFSSASTVVDQLRQESEQLRHENAELRREVGAQTSMLTSRNREKERLYQEIEDLKLGQRRGGGSLAGDSILERSASRAHERSLSRNSSGMKHSALTDAEREDFENKNAELRDRVNTLKMQNQDLQHDLNRCMEEFDVVVEASRDSHSQLLESQEEYEVALRDLQELQGERDDALHDQEQTAAEMLELQRDAREQLGAYEIELERRIDEIESLHAEIADLTENYNSLQFEIRTASDEIVRLEDEGEVKLRQIGELQQDNEGANREVDELERKLAETNEKIDRLIVQLESAQGEIAFLREEQDGDKIKIGDLESGIENLESALKAAERNLRDENERAKELEERIANERKQRDLLAGREKQELQKYIEELTRDCSAAKDEARRLRKNLGSQEVEATAWRERLLELESNLREVLGDLDGSRSSMLQVLLACSPYHRIVIDNCSPFPCFKGDSRMLCEISTTPSPPLQKGIASSRTVILCWNRMASSLEDWPTCLIKNDNPIARRNPNLSRTKRQINIPLALSPIKNLALSIWRTLDSKTARSSLLSRIPSRIS